MLVVKNLPASAGDIRDGYLIPGLGRSPGEGNGNPLQYSCLENPMDRGAWWVKSTGLQRVRYKRRDLARMHTACMAHKSLPETNQNDKVWS